MLATQDQVDLELKPTAPLVTLTGRPKLGGPEHCARAFSPRQHARLQDE
jgi:hypothetical protein